MASVWSKVRNLFNDLWRLRPYLRGGRRLLGAVVATSLGAAALEVVAMSLLAPLISLILQLNPSATGRLTQFLKGLFPGMPADRLTALFAGFVLLAIAGKNLLVYVSGSLAARLKARVHVNLRDSLFQRLQTAPLDTFERRQAGELTSIFLHDSTYTVWLFEQLLLIFQRACIGLAYLTVIVVISWKLTLLAVVLGAGIGLPVGIIHRRARRCGIEVTQRNRRLSGTLVESFGGVRVVRSTNAQAPARERFLEDCRAAARTEEAYHRSQSLVLPFAETVAVAGALLIMTLAAVFFMRPAGTLGPDTLAVFSFNLMRLLPLLNQLYVIKGMVLYYSGSLKEVLRWLDTPRYPARPFGRAEFEGVRKAIRFEDVSFAYASGKAALDRLDLEIPAGRTVALVGASGSGKSTIAALLLRLREPTSGRITVDGRDCWEFTPASWHGRIGVVEQEAFLFHDTIANNIAVGFPEATREDIQRALRLAHLEAVVADKPQGLDTVVGERGAQLSGGQKQRLAIARALVRNPAILILDEATSALDNESERLVQALLESAMADRTVLVIAHRLTTIVNADHIVVLENGRIAEQGTWDELMLRGGAFSRLVRSSTDGQATARVIGGHTEILARPGAAG